MSTRAPFISLALSLLACAPPSGELVLEVRATSVGGYRHLNPLLNTGRGEGWTIEVAAYRGETNVMLDAGDRLVARGPGGDEPLGFSGCRAWFLGSCVHEVTYRGFLDEVAAQATAELVIEIAGAPPRAITFPLLADFALVEPTWGAATFRGLDSLAVSWSTDAPSSTTSDLSVGIESNCLVPIAETVPYEQGDLTISGEDIVLDAGVTLPEGGACVGDLILRRQVAVDGVLVTQDRAVSVLTYPPGE